MIREEINKVLAEKGMSKFQLSKDANTTYSSLCMYLQGKNAIGIETIERIFRVLSIHVIDENSDFFYYGYDLRNAILRGIIKNKTSAYQLSKTLTNISQPTINRYLNGTNNARPNVVEELLKVLGLQVQEITPPSRLPRIKGIPRIKLPEPTFSFGIVIRERLAELGISLYRFAVDNGFNTGGISVFLNKGTALGIDEAERIFQLLNLHLKDDTTDYGTDLRGAIIAKTGKCPVRASVAKLDALAIGAGLKLCKP